MNRSQAAVKEQTTQRPTPEAVLGSSQQRTLGSQYLLQLCDILNHNPARRSRGPKGTLHFSRGQILSPKAEKLSPVFPEIHPVTYSIFQLQTLRERSGKWQYHASVCLCSRHDTPAWGALTTDLSLRMDAEWALISQDTHPLNSIFIIAFL